MGHDRFGLDDRIAIVTGASRGIGRAIALGLAQAGAHVVLAARKLPDLEAVAQEIAGLGRRALPLATHMARRQEIERLVAATLAEFGRVDILVNNAATNPVFGPLIEVEEEAWDKIMALNLKGYLLASQLVARPMIDRGKGAIVNVASTGGIRASPGLGVYSISKAAVLMLTRVLAKELGPFGVRVNAIAPGLIQTRFSQALWGTPEILEGYLKGTPMGRVGQPEETVGAAVYLASDAASYVTGTTIILDGGGLA